MKILYFDCFSGISGDMTLGAFLDAGLKIGVLRRELKRLKLGGYEISAKRVKRGGIMGTKFDCAIKARPAGGSHAHSELKSILRLIEKSAMPKPVKETAALIFTTLGKAEAAAHGCPLEDVHFHEVGNVDSIVDIVGAAIAIHELGIEKISSSAVVLGKGYALTQAGILPVPSPATMALLKGIPVSMARVEAEIVTPTGASILKALCGGFGPMPAMRPSMVGYGAGSAKLKEMPNMLRVVIGDSADSYGTDSIFVVETNIDDMSPQVFEYLFERLFKEGALDVYITPIQMKKSRPAFCLSVIAKEHVLEKIAAIIFEETSSIGLRYHKADRLKLERRAVNVRTKYGDIRMKVASGPGGIIKSSPEYDDCLSIAKKNKIPFELVYEEAKRSLK